MKYYFMGNPITVADRDDLWCVVGSSDKYGSGVLVWCPDENYAKYCYDLMKDDKDFKTLSYEKYA